jgi:hypothetical protein
LHGRMGGRAIFLSRLVFADTAGPLRLLEAVTYWH